MKKTLLLFISLTLGLAFQHIQAQSLAREVIGSAGTFALSSSGSMAWSIGEVMVETYATSNSFFTQGFHQPETKVMEIVWDFFIPEGFSPNGDGINDLFVIRGIQHYKNNTMVIFNRWGNKIFETKNYQNTWDGASDRGVGFGGNKLPVGTYFYVLNLGDGSAIFKGTIYLNR